MKKMYKLLSSSNKIRVIKLRLGWTCNNVEERKKIVQVTLLFGTRERRREN